MGLTMASPSQAAVPPTLKAQLESGGFNYWKSGPQTGTAPISYGTTRTGQYAATVSRFGLGSARHGSPLT